MVAKKTKKPAAAPFHNGPMARGAKQVVRANEALCKCRNGASGGDPTAGNDYYYYYKLSPVQTRPPKTKKNVASKVVNPDP